MLIAISGIFYPITALPDWVHPIALVFPVYWLGLGMRDALLPEAAGAAELGGECHTWRRSACSGLWAVVGLAVAPAGAAGDGAARVRVGGGEPQAGRAAGLELTGGAEQRDRPQPDRHAPRGAGHLAPRAGRRAQVHYQTIGYLERGEYSPSLYLALKIAQFFDVPTEVVFSLTPFPRLGDRSA